VSDGLLRGKPVEAMIALIGRIAAQELPGPIGIADNAQVVVVVDFGGPVRSHIEPSTRHCDTSNVNVRWVCALRRTSSLGSVLE